MKLSVPTCALQRSEFSRRCRVWLTRGVLQSLVAAAALWVAQAQAGSVGYLLYSLPSETATVAIDEISHDVYAGGLGFVQGPPGNNPTMPSNYITVCIDMGGTVDSGANIFAAPGIPFDGLIGLRPTWGAVNTPAFLAAQGGAADTNNAAQAIRNAAFLFYTYGNLTPTGISGTPEHQAALQLAVWSALYNTDTNGHVTADRFQVLSGDLQAIQDASNWVANLDGSCPYTGSVLFPITSGIQEFLVNPFPSGVLDACTNCQTSLPTYGTVQAPTAGKDSLIFITHGWIPAEISATLDTAWVDTMSNSVVEYLNANNLDNWQVEGYKWLAKAQPSILDPWNAAQAALGAGQQEGVTLGNQIASHQWANIHLIAHSAGAGLIEAISEQIKSNSPSTVVQCTFLDAFLGKDFAGYTNYGKAATWSDNYFSRDLETGKYTEGCLSNAYNVDVTQLDTSDRVRLNFYISSSGGTFQLQQCYKTEATHGWPIDFYNITLAGNPPSGYESFGWPLSQEGGLFSAAESIYTRGNYPAQVLGTPDPSCSQNVFSDVGAGTRHLIDVVASPVIQSVTGIIQRFYNAAVHIYSGSPAWIGIVFTTTNMINTLSFDAEFTSATGSHGLLSVYWDTNMVGLIDEDAIQPGFQHYAMSFPSAAANTSHVLGFHLDAFTATQSSVLLTNIAISAAGISEPFALSVTTNMVSGVKVFRLTGQSGFEYNVQASTDMVNWTNIAILANTNGVVDFVDMDSVNYSMRFYRAMVP